MHLSNGIKLKEVEMNVVENSKVIDWNLYDPKYKFLLVMETTIPVETDKGLMPTSEFSWLLAEDPRGDDGCLHINGEIHAMGGFGFGNGLIVINKEIDYIKALELHIKPVNEFKKDTVNTSSYETVE